MQPAAAASRDSASGGGARCGSTRICGLVLLVGVASADDARTRDGTGLRGPGVVPLFEGSSPVFFLPLLLPRELKKSPCLRDVMESMHECKSCRQAVPTFLILSVLGYWQSLGHPLPMAPTLLLLSVLKLVPSGDRRSASTSLPRIKGSRSNKHVRLTH